MAVPQIVSGQMQRCVRGVTDRLIAEPQADLAYLDRMLIATAPSIRLSVVMHGEI